MLHTQVPALIEQISWLLPRLPESRPFAIRGEADYYGASHEIAWHLGLDSPPVCSATWQHGWLRNPPVSARALVASDPSPRVHLLTDSRQETLLLQAGYPNALAVGLPFLYTPASGHPRMPGSLLAAPFHSLPEIAPPEAQIEYEETFTRCLLDWRSTFSCVCVCLHISCVQSGLWIRTLEKHGIPWVLGARTDDAFGLRRIRALFDSFEVVLSNSLGSVIPCAAHAGARVCIHGPFPPRPSLEAIAQHPTYQKYPELLERMRKERENAVPRLPFPFLRVPPAQAPLAHEWAAEQLGAAHQIPHDAIARLLGWRVDPLAHVTGPDHRRRLLISLGSSPPALGDAEQQHRLAQLLARQNTTNPAATVENLLAELKDLRRQNKQLAKLAPKAQDHDALLASWTWRLLAKPLHSIEKRLRGLLKHRQ